MTLSTRRQCTIWPLRLAMAINRQEKRIKAMESILKAMREELATISTTAAP